VPEIPHSMPFLLFKVSIEKTAVILMGLPLYVIVFFSLTGFNVLSLFSVLLFNDYMLWGDSILVKSVSCPGGFLYLNGQNFLEIWVIFFYYFIDYITNPFGLDRLLLHDSQVWVWSFDGVDEFLHIPFTALELFE
jgi:hypothetical protein